MARCGGTTRDGRQCTAIVKPPNTYCYQHDPARSEERTRNASKAGKSKPNRELAALKARLSVLAEQVINDEVDRSRAAVAGQLLGTVIRAVAVELKVREQLDLVERLEALERLMEDRKGDTGSGISRATSWTS